MTDKIRWGILGTGGIAGQFARGLAEMDDAELVAVGSRSQGSADRFGDEFNILKRYASYESLVADPDIDAIYIGTPHPYHAENSKLCLNAGKAVLCEKPFTINAKEAKEVVDLAREKGLFLMEAMWTRYLPVFVRVRELLADGAIGDVRMVKADFGFRSEFPPESRWLNLELGGGALLDVGIYPISLASMVLGKPTDIISAAHIGETGVDEQGAITFRYDEGKLAVLTSAISTRIPGDAYIIGTKGYLQIHDHWWVANRLTLAIEDKGEDVFHLPYVGNGFMHEAAEVGRCLREGKLESDILPLDETLQIMETMDTIRAQWGLKYPME